jgi:hypothetical protein
VPISCLAILAPYQLHQTPLYLFHQDQPNLIAMISLPKPCSSKNYSEGFISMPIKFLLDEFISKDTGP